MNADKIRSILVVGAGTMGWQISLQFALGGYPVVLADEATEALERARLQATAQIAGMVEAGRMEADEGVPALGRLSRTTDVDAAAPRADFVVEAIYENVQAKRELFARLDRLCPNHAILATNSSSIRSSLLDDATRRRDKVLNLHFFRLPWDKPLVEIMRASQTSDETVAVTSSLCRRIGLVPLLVKRESTGFIFNRIWRAIKRESLAVVDGDYASFEDVDRAFMLVFGYPLGPFGLMDQVGLDVVLAIEEQYYAESGDEKDRPPHILKEKVASGDLGAKSGRGFYTYPDPEYERPGWLKGASGDAE